MSGSWSNLSGLQMQKSSIERLIINLLRSHEDEGDAIVILDPVAADGGLPGFGMSNPYPGVFVIEHLACGNLSCNKIKSDSLGLKTNYILSSSKLVFKMLSACVNSRSGKLHQLGFPFKFLRSIISPSPGSCYFFPGQEKLVPNKKYRRNYSFSSPPQGHSGSRTRHPRPKWDSFGPPLSISRILRQPQINPHPELHFCPQDSRCVTGFWAPFLGFLRYFRRHYWGLGQHHIRMDELYETKQSCLSPSTNKVAL